MRTRLGIITLVLVVGVAALWMFSRKPASPTHRISMWSDPFPLVLGPTTLFIQVTDSSGTVVNAQVNVRANMMMEGMLPINMQRIVYEDGIFKQPIEWPMAGQWMVDVEAKIPGEAETMTEHFDVYVYSTAVNNPGGPAQFVSESQNRAMDTDPAHQMVIIIPQGTRVLMLAGQAPDVIPQEVHLNVNGLNTLVIQNNDIVDHTVGPYVVRAGETLRQTFTRPAMFQGKCSANVKATVSIIVDG